MAQPALTAASTGLETVHQALLKAGWIQKHLVSLSPLQYTTTRLLVECLNSDGCMLSPQKRRELQAALFLPIASLQSQNH